MTCNPAIKTRLNHINDAEPNANAMWDSSFGLQPLAKITNQFAHNFHIKFTSLFP